MKIKPKKLSQVVTYREALRMGPKRFVREVLFPFMRREAGNGFIMDHWICDVPETMELDDVKHKVPACGTAACIGGSLFLLTGVRARASHIGQEGKLGVLLGLNEEQAEALFYHWKDTSNWGNWPYDLQEEFSQANTPARKERVAEKMIRRALKDPSCLDPK